MYRIILGLCFLFTTSIYSLQYTDSNGTIVSMNDYQHKRILIVNIATGSKGVNQLAELQQLYQQFKDSLAIIVFPSNSFGQESRSNSEIKQFCQENYGTTFKIAAKSNVTGPALHPVYKWLTKQNENGAMSGDIGGDFQKFLINSKGTLIGVFSPSVRPLDPLIVTAITEN